MTAIRFARLQLLLTVVALCLISATPSCGADQLQSALTYAKGHQKLFNEQLMDLIAIPSISALPSEFAAVDAMTPHAATNIASTAFDNSAV